MIYQIYIAILTNTMSASWAVAILGIIGMKVFVNDLYDHARTRTVLIDRIENPDLRESLLFIKRVGVITAWPLSVPYYSFRD